jgi:hypothetical protein
MPQRTEITQFIFGQPLRKAARDVQRHARKIEPGRCRAASHEAERVAPDMALQMEDALSGNVAEFGGFDGVESVLTWRNRSSRRFTSANPRRSGR